jgi:thymidylate kinase
MKQSTIFITGAEGVGKSSILEKIKLELPETEVHDFDEVGVPKNPPLKWRLDTTLHWLKFAMNKQSKKINVCIIGLSFPKEIKSFGEFKKLKNVYFLLLDINEKEREKRLVKRGASREVISDKRSLVELRKQIKNVDGKIIDTSNLSINDVSSKLIKFLEKILK